MRREHCRSAGFSLVEVMVAAALVVPMLLVVGAASRGVVGAITTTERTAETTAVTVRALGTIERILQYGRISTLRVEATLADVRAGLASAVGQWFDMPGLQPRPGIELFTLTGERQLELRIPSQLCRFQVVRDATELANGRDDDGDGLIDEGELQLVRGGQSLKLLDGVELCTFELDGGVLRLTLRYGRPARGQEVRKTTLHHTFNLRNQ